MADAPEVVPYDGKYLVGPSESAPPNHKLDTNSSEHRTDSKDRLASDKYPALPSTTQDLNPESPSANNAPEVVPYDEKNLVDPFKSAPSDSKLDTSFSGLEPVNNDFSSSEKHSISHSAAHLLNSPSSSASDALDAVPYDFEKPDIREKTPLPVQEQDDSRKAVFLKPDESPRDLGEQDRTNTERGQQRQNSIPVHRWSSSFWDCCNPASLCE
jgi:hypothetical protein